LSRNIDVQAVCPFFVEEAACGGSRKQLAQRKLVQKRRIRCEGLSPGGKITVEFKSELECEEHRYSFCYSKCWKGCPLAGILNEKYKEGESNGNNGGR